MDPDAPHLAPGAPAARAAGSDRTAPPRSSRRSPRCSPSRCSCILVGSVFVQGVRRAQLGLLHEGRRRCSARPAAGSRPRSSARSMLVADRDRDRASRSATLVAIYVSEFAQPELAPPGEALARRPERLPVDRDRHLRLRAAGEAGAAAPRLGPPAERVGGRLRALDHHAPARCAHDDGGARARAEPPARGELRARRLEVAHGAQHRAADGVRRDPHRDDARRRTCGGRDRAAALHVLDLRRRP